MKISFVSDTRVEIEEVCDFDLVETFNCGQCFRWNQITQDTFVGVAFGKVLKIAKEKNKIMLEGDNLCDDFKKIWLNYFDLETDYGKIKLNISKIDTTLKEACKYAPGIRILKQDPWESLCSFIISQNNNIPRIKGIIDRLCENFGEKIESNFFSFPSSSKLAKLSKEDLAPLRCGFRDNYILDAAKKVFSGEVNLEKVKELPLNEARKELMKIKGVGLKIADCTLLYGFYRLEAFPVDVWMNRILTKFFKDKDASYFGKYAGIAQQYLFHYIRMNPSLVK